MAQPGELLFEFMRGLDRIRCELRDHGEVHGVEAQFLEDGFPVYCRTFNPRLDPTRTPRGLRSPPNSPAERQLVRFSLSRFVRIWRSRWGIEPVRR